VMEPKDENPDDPEVCGHGLVCWYQIDVCFCLAWSVFFW
jgi:hypothetical protein